VPLPGDLARSPLSFGQEVRFGRNLDCGLALWVCRKGATGRKLSQEKAGKLSWHPHASGSRR